jgi:hypothetical protein
MKFHARHACHLQWYLSGPDSEIASVVDSEFARDRGDMVDEAKILERKKLGRWRWVNVEIWEWEAPCLLPTFNLCLDLRSPQQIRLLRGWGSLFLDGHIHVRTATVVLRTISTTMHVSMHSLS